MAKAKAKTRVTAKQKSARRKNIRVAQQSKKKNSGKSGASGTMGKRAKQAHESRGVFKAAFKKARKAGASRGWATAEGHGAMKALGGAHGKKKLKAFTKFNKKIISRDYGSFVSDLSAKY